MGWSGPLYAEAYRILQVCIAILLLPKPDLLQSISLGFHSPLLKNQMLVVANHIVDVGLSGVIVRCLGNPVIIFSASRPAALQCAHQIPEGLSARMRRGAPAGFVTKPS